MTRTYFAFLPFKGASDDEPEYTREQVGGKALSLLEASANGFSVPPGFVLTVDFFLPWTRQVQKKCSVWKELHIVESGANATEEQCNSIKGYCREYLELTTRQKEELGRALMLTFGGESGLFAVRSSSPMEDLATASFAGCYESILAVAAVDLPAALITCFSSIFDYRIFAYKLSQSMSTRDPSIAIIIQRQIDSKTSGVASSINALNNSYDEITVTASFGLGTTVVDGSNTPDVYIVDKINRSISKATHGEKTTAQRLQQGKLHTVLVKDPMAQALSDEDVLRVARLVERIENWWGGHHHDHQAANIEWAFDDQGTLYLLQARPEPAHVRLFPEMMTARGEPKRIYMDLLVRSQGLTTTSLSVLGLDVWKRLTHTLRPNLATEGAYGYLWHLHGRQYMNISNLLASANGTRQIKELRRYDAAIDRVLGSLDWEEYSSGHRTSGKHIHWVWLLAQLLPTLLKALIMGESAMFYSLDSAMAALKQCGDKSLSVDGAESLSGFVDRLLASKFDLMVPKMLSVVMPMLSKWRLRHLFQGQSEHELSELLNDLFLDAEGNPAVEMSCAMQSLASHPEIRGTKSVEEFRAKLDSSSAAASLQVASLRVQAKGYMLRFGFRGEKEIDVATPRTFECVDDFFWMLKSIDSSRSRKTTKAKRERAHARLAEIARVRKSLSWSWCGPWVFAAAMAIGMASALTARSVNLESSSSILLFLFLESFGLFGAVLIAQRVQEHAFEYHARIIRRVSGFREQARHLSVFFISVVRRYALEIGNEFVQQERLDRPEHVFDLTMEQVTAAQTDTTLELRSIIESNLQPYRTISFQNTQWPLFIDSRGKILHGSRSGMANCGGLVGDPLSRGQASGRIIVMSTPSEKKFEEGAILVTRSCEPSWTPILIMAAGVIMEVGGPLQHGVLVAKERGIPCISGVENATTVFVDGMAVEMDGMLGTINIRK